MQSTTLNHAFFDPAGQVSASGIEPDRDIRRRGFPSYGPQTSATTSAWEPSAGVASSNTAVLSHRPPHGRYRQFVIMLGVAYTAWSIWPHVCRTTEYGLVSGRIVRVGVNWDGVVQSVHVREGDRVHQGDLVAAVIDPQIERQLEQTRDALQLAQSTLQSELARSQWNHYWGTGGSRRVVAEYHVLWGNLLQEQAQLDELRDQRQRAEQLVTSRAMADEQVESLRLREKGQAAKVEQLATAVAELRNQVEVAEAIKGLPQSVHREFSRIESLRNDLRRLRKEWEMGFLRAPVSGTILARHRLTGEPYSKGGVLLEICEADSLEIICYVPQERITRFPIRREVSVVLDRAKHPIRCVVVRHDTPVVVAPPALRPRLGTDARVIAVHCRPILPISEWTDDLTVRQLGFEVRVCQPRWAPQEHVP